MLRSIVGSEIRIMWAQTIPSLIRFLILSLYFFIKFKIFFIMSILLSKLYSPSADYYNIYCAQKRLDHRPPIRCARQLGMLIEGVGI